MISTVIFDIDGTLVDSNDAHTAAWVETLARFGRTVSFETIRPLIGMGGDKLLPRVTGIDPDSDLGRRISADRARHFRDRYLPQLQPTRGAASFVQELHDLGLTLAIATSAKADEVTALLTVAGVADLFDVAGSSDDVERSKPDPDIVHAALEKAGASADEAVMVGDTPYDIEAASQAHVPCIVVRCGGWWKDSDLGRAVRIADDPAALLEDWKTLGAEALVAQTTIRRAGR